MKNIKRFVLCLCSIVKLHAQDLQDFFNCSEKIIQQEQIQNLTIDDLRFLNNNLYARKRYKFSSPNIEHYYTQFDWYKPVKDNKLKFVKMKTAG